MSSQKESKNKRSINQRWYGLDISDVPKKNPTIAWILRVAVGAALAVSLTIIAIVPNLSHFKPSLESVKGVNTIANNKIFTPQAVATANLSLTPNSGNFKVGEIFPIDIQLNAGGNNIVAVAAYLHYDRTKLEVVSLDVSSSVFSYELENTIDSNSGRILITRGQPTPGVVGSGLQVARINFKGLAAVSSSAVSLDFTGVDASGDSAAILNDGLGSDVLLNVSNGSYNVSAVSCVENWTCAAWSPCSNGSRTRVCTDGSSCGTTIQKPSESQTCSLSSCVENWTCYDWSSCSNNAITRLCSDRANCGTENDKPAISGSCDLAYNPDTINPNTKISNGPLKPVKLKTVKIAWNGIDDQTAAADLVFSFRLDGGPWSPFLNAKEKEFSGLRKGGHFVEVRARDKAGNIDATPAKISFITDPDSGVIVGSSQDGGPQLRLFTESGKIKKQFWAYEKSFKGGVSFTAADLGDDFVREIITGPGKGRDPEVRIFRMDGSLIDKFLAYPKSFRGGVNVAVGDLDGDGNKEIITAPLSGAERVKVFRFQKGRWVSLEWDFFPYSVSLNKGVNIAVGDFDGDSKDELAITPSVGGPSVLRVFGVRNGKIKSVTPQIKTFSDAFRGGTYVAAGDLNGDGKEEMIISVASKGGPQIQIFGIDKKGRIALVSRGFFAFDKNMKNGVSVETGDFDGSGKEEIVAAIAGKGDPLIRVFSSDGKTKISEFKGFPFTSMNGLRIGKW